MTQSNGTSVGRAAHFEHGGASMDDDCAVCEYAHRHGDWDSLLNRGRRSRLTHCRDCHRTYRWFQAHCTRCHCTFSSTKTFGYHSNTHDCDDPATRTRRDGAPFYEAVQTDLGIVYRRWDPRGPYSRRSMRTTTRIAPRTAGSPGSPRRRSKVVR